MLKILKAESASPIEVRSSSSCGSIDEGEGGQLISYQDKGKMSKTGFTPLQSVRKFYFLEYFYVLLKSIERVSSREEAFELFKMLKQEHKLGESKYKKLTAEPVQLTKVQLDRYRYTYKQVIDESREYELLREENDALYLTEQGKRLIYLYEKESLQNFHEVLFGLMEKRYNAFDNLLKFLYNSNKFRSGLLVLPSYSPRQLKIDKADIKTHGDFLQYLSQLCKQLQADILKYTNKEHDLSKPLENLKQKLFDGGLILRQSNAPFNPKYYNRATKKTRDFWISYFLRNIFCYEGSAPSFEIWTFRAKQIGIVNATDFYPGFSGRIVYPTAVINKVNGNRDFKRLFTYPDGRLLLLHAPLDNENTFVDFLVKDYFLLKNQANSYFVNLLSLRELVCYNMKISETTFESLLNSIYRKNLSGDLKVRLSLEVDRLPEDTKSMYLKRTPVMVDGKYRNIIAIDLRK